jgi:hypothetical protein
VPADVNAATYEDLPVMDAVEEPLEIIGGVTLAKGAFFVVDKILKSFVICVAPIYGQSEILPAPGMVMRFKAKSEIKNNGISGDVVLGGVEYVICAGLNERYYAEWKDRFWGEYLKNGFLSYCPSYKVLPGQPLFLYFLNNLSPTPLALKLRVQRTYVDGSEDAQPVTRAVQASSYMMAYSVPVGLDVVEDGKPVSSYMCWLVNEANKVVSKIYTYEVDRDVYEETRFVIFRNSLGGYDTLAATGMCAEQLVVNKEYAERHRPFESVASFADNVVNLATGVRELTINTGWLKSDEREWLEELALSEECYLVTDREHLPIRLIEEDYVNYDNREQLIGRKFVFAYANAERSYSKLLPVTKKTGRATGWRSYAFGGCELDAFGKRTGKRTVGHLEKYYIDDNSAVKPLQVKLNVPGTDGYLLPETNAACAGANFLNAAYTKIGTFKNTTCGNGFYGEAASITIAANRWGSEESVAAANDKAKAEWEAINTQAYADANGGCSVSIAGGLDMKFYKYANNNLGIPPVNVFSNVADVSVMRPSMLLSDALLTTICGANEYVAVRMTGYLAASVTGAINLKIRNDDGCRLWLDGVKLFDDWITHGTTTTIVPVNVVAGVRMPIVVEYFEYNGAAEFDIEWEQVAGAGYVTIPSTALYHV